MVFFLLLMSIFVVHFVLDVFIYLFYLAEDAFSELLILFLLNFIMVIKTIIIINDALYYSWGIIGSTTFVIIITVNGIAPYVASAMAVTISLNTVITSVVVIAYVTGDTNAIAALDFDAIVTTNAAATATTTTNSRL